MICHHCDKKEADLVIENNSYCAECITLITTIGLNEKYKEQIRDMLEDRMLREPGKKPPE